MDSGLQLILSGAALDQNAIFTRLFWRQSTVPVCSLLHNHPSNVPIMQCVDWKQICVVLNKLINRSVFAPFGPLSWSLWCI